MLAAVARYVLRLETPVRRHAHRAVARFAPELRGRVVELGGFAEGRRAYATGATEYRVTNVTPGDSYLDASAMDLPDASVDGFVCESMLEHVEDPEAVIAEIRRVLVPNGRVLLLVPWMYPYHAAPDDFARFSESGLRRLLAGFEVVSVEPVGDFWTTMATFLQLKVSPWRTMDKPERLGRILVGAPLLALGLAFWGVGSVLGGRDDFASMYCVVAEKLPSS